MATRCLIKVKDSDVILYRHWDGYPENIVPILSRLSFRKTNMGALASIMKFMTILDFDPDKDRDWENPVSFKRYISSSYAFFTKDELGEELMGAEFVYTVDYESGVVDVYDVFGDKHVKVNLEKNEYLGNEFDRMIDAFFRG